MQTELIKSYSRPKGQLLKWVGNKYKFSSEIVKYFKIPYRRYFEPFVGTGAILGALKPNDAVAGDTLKPLIELWHLVKNEPSVLSDYYEEVITEYNNDRKNTYNRIKEKYNQDPNPLDLLIISRTCYGGVMRFTNGGTISTPIGPHKPIAPTTFKNRLVDWHYRVQNTVFQNSSFEETFGLVGKSDLVYCDPPYVDSQSILYGAQDFSFQRLIEEIGKAKANGAYIALSIDGKKKSGKKTINLNIPKGLFETEVYLECGSSMLKRFQNGGNSMVGEDVSDRLLLTWLVEP